MVTKKQISQLEKAIDTQHKEELKMLDDIKAAVAERTAVDDSVRVLLKKLADKLSASANDPAAVAAIAKAIRDENSSLADAVTANTPAEG